MECKVMCRWNHGAETECVVPRFYRPVAWGTPMCYHTSAPRDTPQTYEDWVRWLRERSYLDPDTLNHERLMP